MVTNTRNRWMLRGATFLLWAGAAGCAVFWGLRLAAPASGALVAPVDAGGPAAADPVAVARLLGASSGPLAAVPVAAVASRFTLLGVLAGRDSGGAALIAVDTTLPTSRHRRTGFAGLLVSPPARGKE